MNIIKSFLFCIISIMYSRLSWILIRIQKRKHMVCFFTYYVLSHTHVTHVTHTFSLLYICITYVISKMISLHTVTHTYIHVTYIYTCRYVAKVDSVHCSPPTPNYINDKIYSCVQFLSSTSLTQTKKILLWTETEKEKTHETC